MFEEVSEFRSSPLMPHFTLCTLSVAHGIDSEEVIKHIEQRLQAGRVPGTGQAHPFPAPRYLDLSCRASRKQSLLAAHRVLELGGYKTK